MKPERDKAGLGTRRLGSACLVWLAALGFFGVLLLTGCNKGEKTAAEVVPVIPVPPVAPIFRDPQVQEHLKQLNTELVAYMDRHGRPTSFEAFVAASQVPVPPPPPRMQFMLYDNAITLGLPSMPAK